MEFKQRKNCINLIRIIAAFNVFYGHAMTHLNVKMPTVISNILGIFCGVPIFFMMSGFLVWMSIERTPSFGSYCKKRVLRLYPELVGGVLLSSITVLIFAWNEIKVIPFVAWMITQSTVFQFYTPDCLRGFGCGTPNGSLWTIGVMVQCYIVLWVLYRLLHKKGLLRWVTFLVVAVLVNIISPLLENYLPLVIYKMYGQTFARYIWLFLIGAFLCEHMENVMGVMEEYWWLFFGIAVVVSLRGMDIGNYGTVKSFFIAPAIIGFAYKYPKLNLSHDISYGFYIYHMVVINVLIELGMTGRIVEVVLSFVITVILAVISYVSIAKIGYRKKTKI